MRKITWYLLASLILVLFTGCVVVRRPAIAPPPPRVEVMISRPGPDYVWISGYWAWKAGGYFWIAGHWVKTRPGRVWIPGHWENRGRHWVWIRGRWRRR